MDEKRRHGHTVCSLASCAASIILTAIPRLDLPAVSSEMTYRLRVAVTSSLKKLALANSVGLALQHMVTVLHYNDGVTTARRCVQMLERTDNLLNTNSQSRGFNWLPINAESSVLFV